MKLDPRLIRVAVIGVVVSILLLLPFPLFVSVPLAWALTVGYYLYLHYFVDNCGYIAHLKKCITARDTIINKQQEILSEVRENYQILQRELKKSLMVLQIKEIKEKRKEE